MLLLRAWNVVMKHTAICASTLLMEAHQDEIPSKIHMEEDMWSDFTPVLRCTPMVMKESRTHQTNCWRITLLKMDQNGPS